MSGCLGLVSSDEVLATGPVVRTRSPSLYPNRNWACRGEEFHLCVDTEIPHTLPAVPFAGDEMPLGVVLRAAWLEAPGNELIGPKSARNRQRPSIVRTNARLSGCASAV